MSKPLSLTNSLSTTSLVSLNRDVLVRIMTELNDMASLYNLLTAMPTLEEVCFSAFTTIARAISTTNLDEPEMYRYVFAVISACSTEPLGWLHDFMSNFFNDYTGSIPLPEYVSITLDTVEYMAEVLDCVQFYIQYAKIAWSFILRENKASLNYPEASEVNVRLALLRIQLYTQLFHAPFTTFNHDAVENSNVDQLMVNEYWDFITNPADFRMCEYLYTAIAKSGQTRTWLVNTVPDAAFLRGLPLMRWFKCGSPYTVF